MKVKDEVKLDITKISMYVGRLLQKSSKVQHYLNNCWDLNWSVSLVIRMGRYGRFGQMELRDDAYWINKVQ